MTTYRRAEDRDFRFVELRWRGPFSVVSRKLEARDPATDDEALEGLLEQPGVYYVLGDHTVYGPRALLYIGKTADLSRRLKRHTSWMAEEWNVEVYAASVDPPDWVDEVESLLIWAHQPSTNAHKIASCSVEDLRIWNTGRCPRLLPDVSARHPWFRPNRARPESSRPVNSTKPPLDPTGS